MTDKDLALNFDINNIDADFITEPFDTLRILREQDPVHVNSDGSLFLTRYEDVWGCYRHPAMSSDKKVEFLKKFGKCPLYTHHTTSLIFNDPPYHTVVRKLLSAAFTPRKLREMESLITGVVDGLLDELEDAREFDFVSSFATSLPTAIISFMLGIPEEYRKQLRGFSLNILGALDPVVPEDRMTAGNTAIEDFSAILKTIIADKRKKGPEGEEQGEVLSSLIFGEVDGRTLTDEELVQNCIFLLNAGHETTTSLVSNSVGILFDAPDQMRRLKEDPSLMGTAIEEFLRYQSPLQIGNRLATEDLDLNGINIPAGTYIHTSIAGANRDPEKFDNPEQVDIGRKPNPHLAFAIGHHVCLGASLARMEGRIAIGRLLDRFPNLQQTEKGQRMGLARFRGWNSLPVRI
ncbi:MAG: cytochrome P450 [Proteobacteria bacterium]|nr:cytochrome P450 [Pseudomonadota bacterium]